MCNLTPDYYMRLSYRSDTQWNLISLF
jgi:hypothetical protein